MSLPAPALSEARGTALREYVDELRALLLLQAWRIDLPDEYPDVAEEVHAQVEPCEGRYIATVRFGPSFWRQPPEEVRVTLTHELLHLTHNRLTDVLRLGAYRQQLGQGLYDHLEAQAKLEAELMVDHLSTVLAPHLPLPPAWPE